MDVVYHSVSMHKTRRDWSSASEVDVTYDDEILIRKIIEHKLPRQT